MTDEAQITEAAPAAEPQVPASTSEAAPAQNSADEPVPETAGAADTAAHDAVIRAGAEAAKMDPDNSAELQNLAEKAADQVALGNHTAAEKVVTAAQNAHPTEGTE